MGELVIGRKSGARNPRALVGVPDGFQSIAWTKVFHVIDAQPNQTIDVRLPVTLLGLFVAFIWHENGGVPYPAAVIDEGVRRALA
ncbi:hypothetical protein ACPTFP_09585 [Pseudomonas aeruginosa]|uniref:hypothetical protein n=1 Tax=Pseudomonas aeruginosa TaxID=287 RepID=UPI00093AE87A|nr:hypothetical protein IPC85_23855 [Pseudomonas aeruginosa]RMK81561.1 hypothetical protein IPC84_19855 [Pseudomonas aeruginosa]